MKIAHIVPYSIRFPLPIHNGRYDWVLRLATLQAESGHDVTIYCNPESRITDIRTLGITDATNDKKRNNIKTFQLAFQNDHDIYHSHFDDLHYELAAETSKPIIFTQHWWPQQSTIALARAHASNNVWAVPPTKYMYEFDLASNIPTKGFIYHGIDLSAFHNTQPVTKNGRLLFVGRIAPEKNLPMAITVAEKAGLGLDIIGKVAEKNKEHWKSLEPRIDGEQIRYLGPKSHDELRVYYASAAALLFPSDINEPFGLVAIESQASGTPVIMKRGGSRGELIIEGKTGFLCETEEEFIAAAHRATSLDSSDCSHFAQNFDARAMVQNYDALYNDLVNQTS